ncbi:DNA-directed RNA polymerase subunit beta [Candidatus Acetothermia bacterium]|nr:MAG: DNA-directed RNA polymerase subunit beta [Candidatus Acetothermia bacterium]
MEYRVRRSYGRIKEIVPPPYLLQDVRDSFDRFITEGIKRAFDDISPIEGHGKDNLRLEFVDPYLGEPRNTEQECKDKDLTYSRPLRVTARLFQEDTLIQETELYIGDFPMMTNRGTFIINGSDNALVNELTRSPGVYFVNEDKNQYMGHILPELGAWLEIVLDTRRGLIRANLDRKGKVLVTVLLKALGFTEAWIRRYYSFEVSPVTVKKLEPYVGYRAAVEVKKGDELLLAAGEMLQKEHLSVLEKAGIESIRLVDKYIQKTLDEDQVMTQEDAVRMVYHRLRPSDRASLAQMGEYFENLYFHPASYHLSEVGRFKVNRKLGLQLKKPVLYPADIVRTIKVLLRVPEDPSLIDEKDHLANKRVRLPGELAENALRTGLARMARIARDKLSKYALEEKDTIRRIISTRTVQGAINQLFYTGRFSQFLEQTNPLTELTHKRRLNALGGGLTKRRAKIEVRDVHPSHYARICPIETPEGQNIGLITSLAVYARVNEYGFLVAPYRRVVNGRVTDEIVYLMADEEERYRITPATTPVDADGRILGERVEVRTGREEVRLELPENVDFIGVSPKALVGVSAALIPFLEHDDSNRALMGANMQRQAVPLLRPEAPLVGTGLEFQAAMDSGMLIVAEEDGEVVEVDARQIVVKHGRKKKVYHLVNFERSNQDTILHHRPVVHVGDKVKKGDLLADGPSSDMGELALGRNLLVAILPYEGYNYEDAIVISERLVRENLLDSIHIEEFEVKAEETKLGPEEITADIPNISKEDLKNLDEDGIVRVGTVVRTGDILVGKITPKGESEPTPEEKIFRSIFGERARNVKNTSLRMPPVSGTAKVIKVKRFSRDQGDELDAGVNELVKVFVAQRKTISVGDKLSGRHGNKGVISTIRPIEEMPFLPDGTPVDVVLNPMGVPSRMNLGQIFETSLGWLAKLRNEYVATPIFDGAQEDEILNDLHEEREKAGIAHGDNYDGKVTLRDGRTGEPYARPITAGYMYILKLEHIADEKIHARSTGPYALITQQPLGGKAQFGGQRLGEMEVWALEAYGAAALLQEMLTVKSDDTRGRIQLYKAILKGEEFPKPGLPESFKVLLRELRSLALYPRIYDRNDHEIEIN